MVVSRRTQLSVALVVAAVLVSSASILTLLRERSSAERIDGLIEVAARASASAVEALGRDPVAAERLSLLAVTSAMIQESPLRGVALLDAEARAVVVDGEPEIPTPESIPGGADWLQAPESGRPGAMYELGSRGHETLLLRIDPFRYRDREIVAIALSFDSERRRDEAIRAARSEAFAFIGLSLVFLAAVGLFLTRRVLQGVDDVVDRIEDYKLSGDVTAAGGAKRGRPGSRLATEVEGLVESHARGADQLDEARARLHVSESERLRIGDDLHDQLGQVLTAMRLLLRALESDLDRGAVVEGSRRLDDVIVLADRVDHDLRSVLDGIRSQELESKGLLAALEVHTQHLFDTSSMQVEIEGSSRRLPDEIEMHLLRIAQSALHNCLEHAEAIRVRVRLAVEEDGYVLEIEDDGRGITQADLGARPGESRLGFTIMRERALAIDAELEILPGPERGTIVRVSGKFQTGGAHG